MDNATLQSLTCTVLQIMRFRMVVRHASSSKSMPFLPKPQNLSGLVGAEAEFDPLGFSDTFDASQQILALKILLYFLGSVLSIASCASGKRPLYVGFKSTPTHSDTLHMAKVKWLRESELKHGRVCP